MEIALHKAQCDDIIEKLPDGMDTVIGTKGVYLSGGEEQRVAVADQFLLVRNGGHNEQKEREDAAQGKDNHRNVCADLKPFVFFDHGVSLSLP